MLQDIKRYKVKKDSVLTDARAKGDSVKDAYAIKSTKFVLARIPIIHLKVACAKKLDNLI